MKRIASGISTPTYSIVPAGGLEETEPIAAVVDATVPDSVKPAETGEYATPPISTPTPEPDEPDDVADVGLIVALSALALVGAAAIATLLPFGRFIAAAIAGFGLVAGLGCLGAEGRAQLVGGGAALLHFLVLAIVLFFPSWFNLDPWQRISIEDGLPGPLAFSHSNQRTILAEWVNTSSESWQFRDVRATVLSATVGPIELIEPKGVKGPSKERYLQAIVRIANVGVERPIALTGWAAGKDEEGVQAMDSEGRVLKLASFEEGWIPTAPSTKPIVKLLPGKFAEVRLIFSAAQSKVEFLRLVLPGKSFGFREELKFQIETGWLKQLTAPKS